MKIPECVRRGVESKGGIKALICELPDTRTLRSRAGFFNALASAHRLKILSLLREQPLCVCVIKSVVRLPDSKLSYHLSVLRDAGLIESREEGKWIIYSITEIGSRAIETYF